MGMGIVQVEHGARDHVRVAPQLLHVVGMPGRILQQASGDGIEDVVRYAVVARQQEARQRHAGLVEFIVA